MSGHMCFEEKWLLWKNRSVVGTLGSAWKQSLDLEGLKKEARSKAIEQAKSKASELASQLGVKLGRVINFSENYLSYRKSLEMAYEGIGGGEVPDAHSVQRVDSRGSGMRFGRPGGCTGYIPCESGVRRAESGTVREPSVRFPAFP